jgi:hypothetical protein
MSETQKQWSMRIIKQLCYIVTVFLMISQSSLLKYGKSLMPERRNWRIEQQHISKRQWNRMKSAERQLGGGGRKCRKWKVYCRGKQIAKTQNFTDIWFYNWCSVRNWTLQSWLTFCQRMNWNICSYRKSECWRKLQSQNIVKATVQHNQNYFDKYCIFLSYLLLPLVKVENW